MSWQNIRSKLRNLWVPEVSNLVDIHIARYRKSGVWDDLGRVSFVYNNEEIFVIADSENWKYCVETFNAYRLHVNQIPEIRAESIKSGAIDVSLFYELINYYINSFNILDVFTANNLLYQIFGILDRRIGKRTLKKNLDFIESNEVLLKFYKIRMQIA